MFECERKINTYKEVSGNNHDNNYDRIAIIMIIKWTILVWAIKYLCIGSNNENDYMIIVIMVMKGHDIRMIQRVQFLGDFRIWISKSITNISIDNDYDNDANKIV